MKECKKERRKRRRNIEHKESARDRVILQGRESSREKKYRNEERKERKAEGREEEGEGGRRKGQR